MKAVLLIAVPGGAIFTLFAWSLTRLSSDAVGMALGLTLGVVAGLPAAALVVAAASRRVPNYEDYDDGSYIDAQPTYADEVTPYYRLARRVAQLPALPERQAQIDQLRAVLDYIETNEVRP